VEISTVNITNCWKVKSMPQPR